MFENVSSKLKDIVIILFMFSITGLIIYAIFAIGNHFPYFGLFRSPWQIILFLLFLCFCVYVVSLSLLLFVEMGINIAAIKNTLEDKEND